MIFTSFEFVIFFACVWVVRQSIRNFELEKWFFLIASCCFYMSWSPYFVLLILGTATVDYYLGRQMARTHEPGRRKLLLSASICVNLGVLSYFKYTNFILGNVWWGLALLGIHSTPVYYKILLPVGISFFTFQSMSYTIDIYRGRLSPCSSARDFFVYVMFFPQLVAGPIVRAAEFLPQLSRRVRPVLDDLEIGLFQFLLGASKKLIISDRVAEHVDLIFKNPSNFDAFALIQATVGYAVQIYCDFSGYSDMAIGCARMLGFRFPENFQMPYASVNITEFWRRWHMTLSSWLRDYLYIPLGGNRHGVQRTYANLMITMVIGGIWHGASWNFIIWGALHGTALVGHKFWLSHRPQPELVRSFFSRALGNLSARALTLLVILIGWIFFRAQSFGDATTVLFRILGGARSGTHLVSPYILAACFAVIFLHFAINKDRNIAEELPAWNFPLRTLGYASLMIALAVFGTADSAPFIYFQF